jgi:hypothetical protein
MVPIFFPLLSGLTARTFVNLVNAQLRSRRQWFGEPVSLRASRPFEKQVLP